MQDIRYHIVQPSNKRDSYSDFDNIDFLLSATGRSLVMGSVRVLGDVTVYPDGIDPATETISFDGLTGSHTWFSQIITSGSLIGQIENLNFYPHMVSSKARASLTREDTFNSGLTCENRCPDGVVSSALLKGTTAVAQDATNPLVSKMNMAPRLQFCLNQPIGENNLAFAKVGDLSVSIIVSQSISALWGTSNTEPVGKVIGVDRNITISNLRLSFTTVADTGVYPKAYQMRVCTSLKQSLQSSYANISTLAPIVADRFWMSFVEQAKDNNPLYNGLACYRPPNISRVEYLWSDSFNTEYTYAFVNEEEMLTNFVKAVDGVVSDNMCSLNILACNDGFGLGMRFGGYIDLRTQKLSINLTSGITNNAPVTCYMFFSGVVSI